MPAKNMPYRKKQRTLDAFSRRLADPRTAHEERPKIIQEISNILDKYPDAPGDAKVIRQALGIRKG